MFKIMKVRSTPPFLFILLAVLLLTACSSSGLETAAIDTGDTSIPEAAADQQPGNTSPEGSPQISLALGSVATSFQSEIIAAVAETDDVPFWSVLPEHTRVTLEGYPISSQLLQPQIYVFPREALEKSSQPALDNVVLLQSLLGSSQEVEVMPFLPLTSDRQVLHVQLQSLDLSSGQGLRYLTWFSQGIVPVNNNGLLYTYQGLTGDGKYYIAAVFPIHHPSLPADGTITGNEPPEFSSDYSAYLKSVVEGLDLAAANSFSPDLAQLDGLLASLEIH
jgi:hypothetical protein